MYLKNGTEVSKSEFNISIEDLAVWRGDGIFEAIKIHQGFPFGVERHIQRFKKSAEKVFFNDIDFDEIKNNIIKVANSFETGYVRTLILRDSKNGYNVFCFHQPPVDIPDYFTLQTQKAFWQSSGDYNQEEAFNIGTKSTSYGMNISHTRKAEMNGFTDALLIGREEEVLEGPTFTFGWILEDQIIVPKLELGILDSITRKYLLDFGAEGKLPVKEGTIYRDNLNSIQAGFVLSTAKHGHPVSRIDGIELPKHDLINQIKQAFQERVEFERRNA